MPEYSSQARVGVICTTCATSIRFTFKCECHSSGQHSAQIRRHTYHIYVIYQQCVNKCPRVTSLSKMATTSDAFIRCVCGVGKNVPLQGITPCKLEIISAVHVPHFKFFLQCEYEYASSSDHTMETEHHTYHIYKVSPQSEYECVSSRDHFVQTGNHT